MSRSRPNLDILEALGDTEAVDDAHLPQSLLRSNSAPKKAPAKPAAKAKPAAPPKPELPPLIKCPPDIMKNTRFCSYIRRGQRCPEGPDCQFAHDEETLKKHKNILQRYNAQERAKMGWVPQRRRDSPNSAEVVTRSGRRIKAELCHHYMRTGRCAFGDKCSFAHSEAELRDATPAGGPSQPTTASADDHAYYAAHFSGAGPSSAPSRPAQHAPTRQNDGAGPSRPPPAPAAAAAAVAGPTAMSAEQLAELYINMDFSDDEEEGLPEAFMCPITQVRLRDPVVAADGYTYERSAIEGWLQTKDSSPMTNEKLGDKVLYPNITLMEAMRVVLGEECFAD